MLNASSWLNDDTFAPVTYAFTTATSDIGLINGVGIAAERNNGTGDRVWSIVSSYEVIAIPEPGTIVLVGIALGSLVMFRRRK